MAHVVAFAVRDLSLKINPDYPNELGFVIKVEDDDFTFEKLKESVTEACFDRAFENSYHLIDPVEVTGAMSRHDGLTLYYCFDLKETKRYDYVSQLADVLTKRNSNWDVHAMPIPALELYIFDNFKMGGVDLFNGWKGMYHKEV